MLPRRRTHVAVALSLSLVAAACGSTTIETAPATPDPAATTTITSPPSSAAEPLLPVSGAALPQFGQGHGNDPAVGLLAPDISATSLDGDTITVGAADGRGKVYGFFAHWCPHCQAELPRLVGFFNTTGLPDEVDFHAISAATNPDAGNFPPEAWFATELWPFPVLDDSSTGAISAAFGLPGFPYFVVVDGDGAVTHRLAGELSDDAAVAALIDLAAEGVS